MNRVFGLILLGLLLVAAAGGVGGPAALAQEAADPPAVEDTEAGDDTEAAAEGADVSGSAWIGFKKKWQQGGRTMWALAFVALIGLIFTVDRVLGLTRGRVAPVGLATRANSMWRAGDYADLVQMAEADGSTLGKVIAFIVDHREAPYEHLTSGAEDIAARDFEVHTRRNHVLSSVGAISPLLGLMGTVFGLMGAFASIGAIGTMDDPSVLANDIGKAMVTTAAGLIIAVPALGLYYYFRSKSGQLASIVGEESSALMHAWFLKKGA